MASLDGIFNFFLNPIKLSCHLNYMSVLSVSVPGADSTCQAYPKLSAPKSLDYSRYHGLWSSLGKKLHLAKSYSLPRPVLWREGHPAPVSAHRPTPHSPQCSESGGSSPTVAQATEISYLDTPGGVLKSWGVETGPIVLFFGPLGLSAGCARESKLLPFARKTLRQNSGGCAVGTFCGSWQTGGLGGANGPEIVWFSCLTRKAALLSPRPTDSRRYSPSEQDGEPWGNGLIWSHFAAAAPFARKPTGLHAGLSFASA